MKATFKQIVDNLVKVLANKAESAQYFSDSEQYVMMCGWCGTMSPISRPAFYKEFGKETTEKAEAKAREIIAEKEAAHKRTKYHEHAQEADRLEGVPAVGGFFWADNSGLKCDGGRGLFEELHALNYYTSTQNTPAYLCCVDEVIQVSEEEFARPKLADELVKAHALKGGSRSEDVDDDEDMNAVYNDPEKLATFYTVGALVVSPSGKYFLIDSEGCGYARYIYVPIEWPVLLADEVASVKAKEEARKSEEERQVPAAGKRDKYGYTEAHLYSHEEAAALADALGTSDIFPTGYEEHAEVIARRAWDRHNYTKTTAPEPTDPTPTKHTEEHTEAAPAQDAAQTDEAPAEGLQLVETAEGVAVVGDSRTTYRNRKAIKAHGATWNKTAQQWQASEPEAVARLRAWFGVSTTPPAEEGDTVHESEQPGSKNQLDALRARLYALNAEGVEVSDLLTIAANISPESVGERAEKSCALETIQRLNSTADRRAAEVLTPDEWQTLFGTPHPKQHAAT